MKGEGTYLHLPIPVATRFNALDLWSLACWKCGFESCRGSRMSDYCKCCVLSGRGLCVGLMPRPDESYRLWCVCVCVCVYVCVCVIRWYAKPLHLQGVGRRDRTTKESYLHFVPVIASSFYMLSYFTINTYTHARSPLYNLLNLCNRFAKRMCRKPVVVVVVVVVVASSVEQTNKCLCSKIWVMMKHWY